MNPAHEAIAELPRDRLVREAIRAHEALMRYGKHDPDCPMAADQDQRDPCDCGLDAASSSPFVRDKDCLGCRGGSIHHTCGRGVHIPQ